LPENAINVARPGKFGNPFVVGKDGTRAECVANFRHLLNGMVAIASGLGLEFNLAKRRYILDNIATLRGKDLACWCALDRGPCHADVLIDLANKETENEN
jgi:hypothetical protein